MEENKPYLYVSGPMRGIPEFNIPLFNAVSKKLREAGHNVLNPAEINDEIGHNKPISVYMKRDLLAIVEHNVVGMVMLEGWQKSEGAGIEASIAKYIGVPLWKMVETTDGIKLVTAEENILEEAQRIVYGARQKDYGHPIDDFTKTGKMWSVILGVEKVLPEQVALCMIAVKISRQLNHPKRDNVVDGAGYFGTLALVMEEKERRKKNADSAQTVK